MQRVITLIYKRESSLVKMKRMHEARGYRGFVENLAYNIGLRPSTSKIMLIEALGKVTRSYTKDAPHFVIFL